MKDEIQQLFDETALAFEKSSIKHYADQNDLHWYYSICSTQLEKNCTLIVGFNWGASKGEKYKPQTEIPATTFKQLYDKNGLGSLQRIYNPLKKYLKADKVDNSIQTNFCFFRSATEDQISPGDIKLSKPLFEKLIQIITPKEIIGFSSKLQEYFFDNNLLASLQKEKIKSNDKTLLVSKGKYQVGKKNIPVYFLPHPNAHFTSGAREKAWKFCFS